MLSLRSYWTYLRIINDYRWMDPWFHGEELCRFLEELEANEEDGLILTWRGSGKTGMITQPMPAWWLAKNHYGRVGISNAIEDKAAKMGKVAAAIITNNRAYKLCFPHVRPSEKWGEAGYYLDVAAEEIFGSKERVDPSISTYGIRGNITGAHLNGGFIFDDLLNMDYSKSVAMRRRAEEFFTEVINIIDPGVPIRGCATRWTYDDYCGKIETGELLGPRGRLRIYKTGVTKKDKAGNPTLVWPQHTYKDSRGMKVKAGETFSRLEAKKKTLKGLFSALYYNEPVANEDIQFDLSMIHTFKTLPPPFELGPVGRIGVECESQGTSLLSTFSVMMRTERRVFQIEKLTAGRMDKKERIRSILQPVIKYGTFNIREDLYRREDNLGEELRTFDKGSDDALDACSYLIKMCDINRIDVYPIVNIAVDPAFSAEYYSDWTAIVAGCAFQGQFWILDCVKFQTNRTDYIVRMLFSMYDKFNNLAFKQAQESKIYKPGYKSLGARRNNVIRRGGFPWGGDSFDVDLSIIQRERKENKLDGNSIKINQTV